MSAYLALFLVGVACVHGAPSWPIPYSGSSDTLPIIQARLAPPLKPMPEVAGLLRELDAERVETEAAQMLEVEAAYNASLKEASEKLPASIDRLMQVFEKPSVLLSLRTGVGAQRRWNAPSFKEAHSRREGQEMSAQINVLPIQSPAASLESRIREIEDKRSRDESNIFRQAILEMTGLTKIVQSELELQITQTGGNLLAALRTSLPQPTSASFLSARQPSLPSGFPAATNVRVMASDEPFPTISSMVEELERNRDASESLIRTRIFEWELKLLQAENKLITARLQSWVDRVLRASA